MRAETLIRLEERLWAVAVAVADALPLRVGQFLFACLGRVLSWSLEGHERTCERLVASTDASIVRIPVRYWEQYPLKLVHRWGASLVLDLRDNVQRCVYFTGSYEPRTQAIIRRELANGGIFVDVGAHIGIHTLAATRSNRRRVLAVAFEPTRDSADRLANAVKCTTSDVEIVRIGLWSGAGVVALRSDATWGRHDAGVRSQFNTGDFIAEVPVASFDEWNAVRGLRPSVVKIDVEGGELAVLQGMARLLEHHPPHVIIIELKDSILTKAGYDRADVVDLVSSYGYREDVVVEHNHVFRHDRKPGRGGDR
jgi:FkbM family methyltransferase